MAGEQVIVGIDTGGTANNVTVLTLDGHFLVDGLLEVPSRVTEGPAAAVEAMLLALDTGLAHVGLDRSAVRAVGLDTPGPASANGVLSSRGGVNFSGRGWWGFDIRGALEAAVGLPVHYSNDGNAAALYAHHMHFGAISGHRSSVSAVVGTGLGGGVIEGGHIVRGAAGMAGELGHVHIPVHDILEPDQPIPVCACGFRGDSESIASLTGIVNNLLPYWLTRFPGHELTGLTPRDGARRVRGLAEQGDELALAIFAQQAKAIGALFTITSNVMDPDAFFVGGGVVEADPSFRDWFVARVADATILRDEQRGTSVIALVPDRDMAGARGAALDALDRSR